MHVRAYSRRLADQLEVGIASVWHGAAFTRAARLPDLEKVLARRRGDTSASRRLDRAFTASETRRWRAELGKQPS